MNNLVNSTYDRFEKKKTVKLKELISTSITESTLELQNIQVAFLAVQRGENEPEIMFMMCYDGNQLNIQEILINLNDEELLCYKQILNSSSGLGCLITIADLEKICIAKTVEIRIKNSEGHTDFTSMNIQLGAKVIYNAVIDETSYVDEIQQQEQIDAEDNKIVEQERITNIEKYTQRDNRIKNRGVNKFFKAEYDKFTQKLEVTYNGELELETLNATMLLIKSNFDFRYVHIGKDNPILIIDIEAISQTNLNLKEGELMLLLNESERLILNPHENYSEPHLESFYRESCWYALTEDELKSLCEAQSVEMRITNGNKHADLSTKDVQLLSRRFYNAIIDETAYTDDLLTQEERDAAERERQRQEYRAEQERLRKEREAKEAEEARIRAEKRAVWWAANKKKVIISILILVCLIALITCVKKAIITISEKKAIAEAWLYIASGDSCTAIYHFDEAIDLYEKAYRITEDKDVRKIVEEKNSDLVESRQSAENEYNINLDRLKILFVADNNEFNELSNACLEKMVEIYPDRQDTREYQIRLANNPSLSAIQDYEMQGDELFKQGQYDDAIIKYKATEVVAEMNGQKATTQLKEKNKKAQTCADLLKRAQAAEANNRNSEAANAYEELYSIHALASYQKKMQNFKSITPSSKSSKKGIHLVIPDGTKEIGDYSERTDIMTVTIPNSVTSIGDFAFANCSELVSVTIGNRVTTIGHGAFMNCHSLSSITIPNSVTSIGNGAFMNCSSLSSITIPNSVMSIGSNAFHYCSELTSVTIPNRFRGKVDWSLSGCKSVTYY